MSRAAEFSAVFLRDLDRLAAEVGAYTSHGALWATPPGVANSGGTLAVHLAGNIQHFVGAQLGGSGYVRDREREFAVRDLAAAEVLAEVRAARDAVEATFAGMPDARLDEPWTGGGPLGDDATVGFMLLHLSGHLMYHTGQVNYHRRLGA